MISSEEVHTELSLLGVSVEVHALVDDLDLKPCVIDYFARRYVVNSACNRYSGSLISKYVYQPKTIRKEVSGRLF